jgi:putative membrane protein
LTLGLFLLVLNAILFALAALLVPGFTIHGFWTAVVGALLYWIATWAINQVVPRDSAAASRRSSSAIWS